MSARMATVSAFARLFLARLTERGWVGVPISRHNWLRWVPGHHGHAAPSLIVRDHVLLRVCAVYWTWMRSHITHPRVVLLWLRVRVTHVRARSCLIDGINGIVRVLAWIVGIGHRTNRLMCLLLLLLPGLMEMLRRILHRICLSRVLRLLIQRTRKWCIVPSHTSIPREWGRHTASRNDWRWLRMCTKLLRVP